MGEGDGLGAVAGLSLGDAGASRSDGESAATVTSVVTGAGATAGEAMTKAVADRASEAALDEARNRMRAKPQGSSGRRERPHGGRRAPVRLR